MLIDIVPSGIQLGYVPRPRTGSGLAGTFVADYLISDIQGNVERARAVLSHLDAVKSGSEREWSEHGNAYDIAITATTVTLDFDYAEEGQPDTVAVPLSAFREAVAAWSTMLDQKIGPLK